MHLLFWLWVNLC